MRNKVIPAIAPKGKNDLSVKQKELLANREEWQRQYTYWLTRKNKFAQKLLDASRTTEGSKKYKELKAEVEKYWNLLRESLPDYKKMFVTPHQ